ncbi:MAG: S-adenosylmethionine decarboxylase family protein [Pyrinomonadaceae bacterium]
MIVGREWIIDASGCRAEYLRDVNRLRAVFSRIIEELALQVVGEQLWRQFPTPGGITGLALLTESHLTCHTYPEFSSATFNLYCCRERPEWPWCERLQNMLAAREVSIRVVERNVIHRDPLLAEVASEL